MNAETERELRVAAYCRVSTEKEQQQLSFDTQRRAYIQRIAAQPGWVLAGIYADEGITGTNTRKRKAFCQMIADCKAGRINFILTKSISRFARNTLDCLQTVRELQSIGVDILFEKENIDTRTPYSEMLLTILAAFAQEESRNLSENLKWSIRSRYRERKCRWSRLYGYTSDGDNHFLIVPEEAAVIRRIFDRYEHGDSVREIIRELEESRIPAPGGKMRWYDTTIYDLFDNEKYVGDLLLQKLYTVDHITHRQMKNDGAVPFYYIEEHHAPIISRQTRRRVLAIRDMRRQNGSGGPGSGSPKTYPFGDMLKCPLCGRTLLRRKCSVQKRGRIWCCDSGLSTKAHFALWEQFILGAMLEACQRADHSEITRVDYWWLDEWVEKIEIGDHISSSTVKVIWKTGLETQVPSGASRKKDNPYHVARLHNAYLERKGLLNPGGGQWE